MGDQIPGGARVLLVKGNDFAHRAGGIFPRFVRRPSTADELGLYLRNIDGAANRPSKKTGSKLLRSGFCVNHGKDRGSIKHDPIHA